MLAATLRRLLTRGDGVLATSLLQQAALLVSGVGSAWLIGDSGRGQLAYGMTVGNVAGLVAAGGWSPAVAVALARRWSTTGAVSQVLVAVSCRRVALALVLAGVGILPFLGKLGSAALPVTCGAIASAVGTVAVQLAVGVWQGQGLSARANLMKSALSGTYAVPIAMFVILHFVFGMPVAVSAVAWMWMASWAVPAAALIPVVLGGSRPTLRLRSAEPTLISRMRSYSRTSFLGSISLYELLRADVLIATLVLSTAGLGQYVVASSFTGLMKALGQAMGVSMLSRAALAGDGVKLGRHLRCSCLAILVAAVAAGALLWPIFHWVLPAEFAGALPAALVLVGASAASSIRRVLVEYAKGYERPAGASVAELAFAAGLLAPLMAGVVERSALGIASATLIGCTCALGVAVVAAARAPKSRPDLATHGTDADPVTSPKPSSPAARRSLTDKRQPTGSNP